MRQFISLFVLASCVACLAGFAAEAPSKGAVEGTWSLTESIDGKQVDKRSSILKRTPEGVGFVYLNDGEFKVPGENAGSRRFTLPRGLHFRIEPNSIDDNGAVADVLLSYTDLKNESDVGFAIEKRQIDGRYRLTFGDPYSVTLSLPETKTEYTLSVELRQAD